MKFKCSLIAILLTLCAFGAQAQVRTRGIDVSKFQGTINWTKVAKDSTIRFVYIRATEGTSIQDAYYKTNLTKARKAGLLVGSYHVYSSKTTAYQQMANMRSMIKKSEQDLIPVLDIEGHHSGRLYMERVDKLLELMEKEYGVKPMIYTSERVYKTHFAIKKYSKYHIFIANYRGYPTTRFTLWQYTEKGHCNGIGGYVDFNRFHRNHSIADIKMPKPKKKPAAQTTAAAAAPAKADSTATK
ncbi:MAG: glycoside hydrolase family 25 protein [Bacteroidales bacterium]|nr:glycoside hydrolase family 25 protein [Bacteroidales bacterium]